MRRIALFLLAAGAAFAQPIISNVVTRPSAMVAQIELQTDSATTNTLYVNYDEADPDGSAPAALNRRTQSHNTTTTNTIQSWHLGPLKRGTRYYFQPVITRSAVPSEWDCNTATGSVVAGTSAYFDEATNAGCDAATGWGWFETTTNVTMRDPDVASVQTTVPAPTLAPIDVTPGADPAANVAALQAAICTASDNTAAGGVQEVNVPFAAAQYIGSVVLPSETSDGPCNSTRTTAAGWVIIRNNDDAKMPPAGVRSSLAWKPVMPQLIVAMNNGSGQGHTENNGFFQPASAGKTHGWYFLGLHVESQPTQDTDPPIFTITGITDGCGTLTVSADPRGSIVQNDMIQIWDVVGNWPGTIHCNGVYRAGAVTSTTIGVNRASYAPYPTGLCTGCYVSGGKVRLSAAANITGATNATPIVITTEREHGLWMANAIAISDISHDGSKTILTTPVHSLVLSQGPWIVDIQGSGLAGLDGLKKATNQSMTTTTITLDSSYASFGACSGSCGTIRVLNPIRIQGVLGNTAANGTHYYKVLTDTTFELWDGEDAVAGNGAYTSGGVVAQAPNFPYEVFGQFIQGSTRIVIDRSNIYVGPWPNNVPRAISFHSGTSALLNSYVHAEYPFPDKPMLDGEDLDRWTHGVDWGTGHHWDFRTDISVDVTHGWHKVIQNNHLQAHGVNVFTQGPMAGPYDESAGRGAVSVLMRRNYLYWPERYWSESPDWDGIIWPHRHACIEWKEGMIWKLIGNLCQGGMYWTAAQGAAMHISPRENGPMADLNFVSNIWRNQATSMYGLGQVGSPVHTSVPLHKTARIRFHNNLFDYKGTPEFRLGMAYDSGVISPSLTVGSAFTWAFGVEALEFDHNTFMPPNSTGSGEFANFFHFRAGRIGGLRMTNNLAWFTQYGSLTVPLPSASADHTTTEIGLPALSGTIKQNWDALVGTDWSITQGNVFMGWTTDPSNPADEVNSALDADVYDQDECETNITGFTGNVCAGGTGVSANAKLTASKHASIDLHRRLFSGSPLLNSTLAVTTDGKDPGADITQLEQDQGTLRMLCPDSDDNKCGPRALDVDTDSATIAYTFLDADGAACTVEYGTQDVFGTGTREQDAGGFNSSRTVALSGLSTATTYYARILCPGVADGSQPTVTFTTH